MEFSNVENFTAFVATQPWNWVEIRMNGGVVTTSRNIGAGEKMVSAIDTFLNHARPGTYTFHFKEAKTTAFDKMAKITLHHMSAAQGAQLQGNFFEDVSKPDSSFLSKDQLQGLIKEERAKWDAEQQQQNTLAELRAENERLKAPGAKLGTALNGVVEMLMPKILPLLGSIMQGGSPQLQGAPEYTETQNASMENGQMDNAQPATEMTADQEQKWRMGLENFMAVVDPDYFLQVSKHLVDNPSMLSTLKMVIKPA